MRKLFSSLFGRKPRRQMSRDERRRAKALMLGAVAGPAVRAEDGVVRVHCEGKDEHKTE